MKNIRKNNFFSQDYYESILKKAIDSKYTFVTFRSFFKDLKKKRKKIAILRHDIDQKISRTKIFHEVEDSMKIKSTNFLLIHDVNYNCFDLNTLSLFLNAEKKGHEIGLHTNFVETSKILNLKPDLTLKKELLMIRNYFKVTGVACHRNIDYLYNSLPYLQKNWKRISKENNLLYDAYGHNLMSNNVFINESTNHLGWRNHTPEDIIESGKNFILSTHPHWWHKEHPFED
ncbi:MAG: hypothetical protein CMP34_01970 [Rickettsiales bacterium]|nr:hypothetical protein [Rickettsiales bacterium]|tara:strand:- start:16 stop:705 length:690 start_codon:yes stop_codon:yes gene_type:complete